MDRQRCPVSGATMAAQTQEEGKGTSVDKSPGHQAPPIKVTLLQVCIRDCKCPQRWRCTPLEGESHKSLSEHKQVYKLELSGKYPGHSELLDATAGALTTNHILDLRILQASPI